MSTDKFASYPDAPSLPAVAAAKVEPNDDADLGEITTGINVETPGHVRVTTQNGDIVDFFIEAGSIFQVRVRRIWASGTTATGIHVLF